MKLRRNSCWKIKWGFSVLLDISVAYELFDLRWVALTTELSMLWKMIVCWLWKQILNMKIINSDTFTLWGWKWPALHQTTCDSAGFWEWCTDENIFTVPSSLQTAKHRTKTKLPRNRTYLTSVLVLRTFRTVRWLSWKCWSANFESMLASINPKSFFSVQHWMSTPLSIFQAWFSRIQKLTSNQISKSIQQWCQALEKH